MKNVLKRAGLSVLLLLYLFSAAPLCPAVRAAPESRTVRIGWYNSNHFQEGAAEGERKSGYSYEYLQTVSGYTGWTYEYVSGGWTELYNAFVNGEIDLMAGLSYTEERAPLMDYPNREMGFESYYIYKRAGNDTISGGDLNTLSGKRVGSVINNLMTACLEDWMAASGIACEEVLYNNFQSRNAALVNGSIDALVAANNNVPSIFGMTPVVMVGESSFYLAVTKSRPDLLAELNRALDAIDENDPYFLQRLQAKYYRDTAVNASLSPEELAWAEERGALRVGCVSAYMPFCGFDGAGKPAGVITDILSEWQSRLDLPEDFRIEYRPYLRYSDLVEALRLGEIDAAFPVYDSIWNSEQVGVVQTENLIESRVLLIYRGEYSEATTRVIAVAEQGALQWDYAVENYPYSKLLPVGSPEECLDAVMRGEATCAFFSSERVEGLLQQGEYKSLNRVTLDVDINYCIGVQRGNNVLYSLLARGISLIDQADMTSAMLAYIIPRTEYTLTDFVRDNVMLALAVALVIIGLIAAVTIVLGVSLRRATEQKNKELAMLRLVTEQNDELEAAKDRLQDAVEQADAANLAKGRFLAQMSHEIRTPINVVLGMNEMILNEAGDDQILDYSSNIDFAGRQLLSIINTILDFSKIEDGKMEIVPAEYDLASVINNLVNGAALRAQMKSLAFHAEVDESLPCTLYGDDVRVTQVIQNILTNGIKYTESGGVTLRVSNGGRDGGDVFLDVAVRDTGIGIRAEDMEKLFASFERLDTRRNRHIEGTGLGMSIVVSLLKMMGSELKVESVYGEGSTFSFRLRQRVVDERPLGNYTERMAAAERQKKKGITLHAPEAAVLVVDDNAMNLKVAKNLLKMSGVLPDLASSGSEAVRMIREKFYDIVFMDHMMPGMDGVETLKKLREENLIPHGMAVIILTANAVVGAKEEYLAAGFADYLSKPINVDELQEKLVRFLPGEKVNWRTTADAAPSAGSGKAAAPAKEAEQTDAAERTAEKDEAVNAPESAPAADEVLEFGPESDGVLEFGPAADGVLEFGPDAGGLPEFEPREAAPSRGGGDALEKLAAAGLQTETGLQYCSGDREFYAELLGDFVTEHAEKAQALEAYYKVENWQDYRILIHALKSTSKTIGASELFERAKELEAAAADVDAIYLKANHAACMDLYQRVTDTIAGALG